MFKNCILLDDHKITLQGLADFIKKNCAYNIIFASDSAEELDAFLKDPGPQDPAKTFAIVDLKLKDEFSFGIIKTLSKKGIKVVVYSMFEDAFYLRQSLEAGASAYAFKGDDTNNLLDAIRQVEMGRVSFPQAAFEPENKTALSSFFSNKEKQVAGLLIEGWTNDEIARRMGIKARTVENYLCAMYDKSGTKNRTGLIKKLKGETR